MSKLPRLSQDEDVEIRKVEKAEAYLPGAPLWVLPDASSSRWARKIDWLLNFQIFRTKKRTPLATSEPIKGVVKELNVLDVNLDRPIEIESNTPILVGAEKHIPARAVLMVPVGTKAEKWGPNLIKLAEALQLSPVRIFLPDNFEPKLRKELETILKKSEQKYELV